MKKIKKINLKLLIKYILSFATMFIFASANILNINPFAVAFVFALCWSGFCLPIALAEYVFCSLFFNFCLQNIYCCLTTGFVLFFSWILHKKFKMPLNIYLVCFYAIFSQLTYIYYLYLNGLAVAKIISFIILLVVCICMFSSCLQLINKQGIYYRLSLNQCIANVFLFIVFGIALSKYSFYNVELVKVFAVFVLLTLNLIKKHSEASCLSLAVAIGNAIYGFDYYLICNIAVLLLATNIFRYPNRYKIYFSVILVDITISVYFKGFYVSSILFVLDSLIAIALSAMVPDKSLKLVQEKFYITENEMNMRNIIQITRNNLHKRFNELSNVFNEMKAIHLNLVKSNLNKKQLVEMFTAEIKKQLCKDCQDNKNCYRCLTDNELSAVSKMIELAISKGKISLLDVPSGVSVKCPIVNILVGKINQIVAQYSQFVTAKQEVNNIKVLLAEQLGAVADIMLDLGKELDKKISFNTQKESRILNELLEQNIMCNEIVIYNENESDLSVLLIIKGDNAYNPEIEKIISKKLKTKMKVNRVVPIEATGFYSVNLVKDNNYDIVFGLANCTKQGSELSGDSHSLIRLGGNRFLLALCDGMGSGKTANKTSALTIGLIENFYKAGFSNELIISSVNKLLSLTNHETYSTLDLCLVDLNNEKLDFIKIGSPYSVLKHQNSTEKIEGCALPIGVLDNVEPYSYKTIINTQSMIIMATDGITDAFKDVDDFCEFVQGVVSTNPQTVAETILNEAIQRNDNVIKDDMTILVARTFKKNC